MTGPLAGLLRGLARHSHLANGLRNARACPGASVSASAWIDARGELRVARDATIRDRASIDVPANASLRLGAGCLVGRDVELQPDPRIDIGDGTSLQDRCKLIGDVRIGRGCLFAPNVYVSSGTHHFDLEPWLPIRAQDQLATTRALPAQPVRIEDDCWIGANVVVLRGVTVGRGAVVGANSVVAADVPPYAVVAGAPARVLRQRLDFAPPARIVATRAQDRPYFYSGFDLAPDATAGGLVAREDFELRLAGEGAALHVVAKSIDARAPGTLHLGATPRDLRADWDTLVFPREDGDRFALRLSGAAVAVREAWIA